MKGFIISANEMNETRVQNTVGSKMSIILI